MSRVWESVTGSWVVHSRPLEGGDGAAAYLAKYMFKGALVRDGLEALGFARRWSRSQGFPGGSQLKMLEEEWDGTEFFYGPFQEVNSVHRAQGPESMLERQGTDLAKELSGRARKRSVVKALRSKIDDYNAGTSAWG
jgi:hypothetical protein